MQLGEAYVDISVKDNQLVKGLSNAQSKVEKSMNAISAKMKNVGKVMTVAGAAITTAFGLTVKSAISFNKEVANIATLIPGSTKRVGELKSAIRDMAVTVGKDTTDLAQGAYQVISAFGDTADTVDILGISAKAATAGVATTTDAINLLSAVTKGYGDTSTEAVQKASDLAFQTVTLGQTTFPELAASIGKVIPLTSELGVSQEELFAVMATGTGVTGKASEVATQLRGVMQALMSPTGDMTKLLEEKGYATGKAMLADLGLADSLDLIKSAAEASGKPLQKYISSIEGQTLALALTGTQADNYITKLAAMKDSTDLSDVAFKEQTEGVNAAGFAFKQAKIQIGVMAQEIGDNLLPVLVPLIQKVTEIIGKVRDWAEENPELVENIVKWGAGIGALMLVLGPLLIILPGLVTAITGLGVVIAAILSPVGLVVIAVAALALAWKTDFGGIQEKTKSVTDFIKKLLDKFMDFVEDSFDRLDKVIKTVKKWAKKTVKYIKDLKVTAIREVKKLIDGICRKFEDLADLPAKALQWGKDIIADFAKGIMDSIGKVTDAVKDIGGKIWDFLKPGSPTKEGPLSYGGGIGQWGADLTLAFAGGIIKEIPQVETAADELATAFKDKMMMMHTDAAKETEDMMDDIEAAVEDSTPDIETKTQTLADNILGTFEGLELDIMTPINNIISSIETDLGNAIGSILKGEATIAEAWETFWTGLYTTVLTQVGNIIAEVIMAAATQFLLAMGPAGWLILLGGAAAIWAWANAQSKNEGGEIEGFAAGGSSTDTVPAMLTPGEYIIAKPMVDFIKRTGAVTSDLVSAIRSGARTPTASFASGGGVGASSNDNRKNYTSTIQIQPGAIVINTPKFSSADGQELFRQIERQARNRGLKFATS